MVCVYERTESPWQQKRTKCDELFPHVFERTEAPWQQKMTKCDGLINGLHRWPGIITSGWTRWVSGPMTGHLTPTPLGIHPSQWNTTLNRYTTSLGSPFLTPCPSASADHHPNLSQDMHCDCPWNTLSPQPSNTPVYKTSIKKQLIHSQTRTSEIV